MNLRSLGGRGSRRAAAVISRWLGGSLALPVLLFGSVFAAELQKFTDVHLVENPSNDGDSFIVQAGDRRIHVRLYFVDCPESVATTDADAKRVREQARYFGITEAKKVFEFGRAAKKFTDETLSKPFTIYTAFAGALGRSPGGRVYAFVQTRDGKDLAELLVVNGLARTYGSKRSGPDNRSTAEILKELQRLEIAAMRSQTGTWAAMDSKQIDRLRAEQREEDAELKELLKASAGKDKDLAPGSVELNTATTGELQAVSGIGPLLAAKIIAGRPYKNVDDLLHVSGMGPRLLERVRPFVVVREPSK